MIPCQIGMNGLVGSWLTPAPCSIVEVSCCAVRFGARLFRAGTYGETPPTPRSPWHCAQANCTNACAPSATSWGTAAVCTPEDAPPLPAVLAGADDPLLFPK